MKAMKAEKQHKVLQAGLIQPKQERSKLGFVDNRPQAVSQTKLIQSIQKKEYKTGLPDNLKTGVENLSGFSMDDVRVHYNSNKPAQLNALAYAQGTDIHVAFGQEKHLPHEVWHVVQQKQGRVQPAVQMQGMNVNDNEGFGREADVMGLKALGSTITLQRKGYYKSSRGATQVIQCWSPDWKSLLKWKHLYNTLPNITAGTLDLGFGLKDFITECGNSRKLIPQGSRVVIPSCTKGKVDGAKTVSGNNGALAGGTYTIEVEDNTQVTSNKDFVSEGWKRKALRMAGSAFSAAAGGVSAVATVASPMYEWYTGESFSETVANKWDEVSSTAAGFGYSLANIVPRLKNRFFGQV